MKKFYLFSLGLLAAAPLFAQEPVPEGPSRTEWDAEEIFFQGFESDWTKFQNDTIDRIDTLFYYKYNGGTGTSIGSDIISKGVIARTDSVIYLKNGVMTTDNQKDVDAGSFSLDEYRTIKDQDNVRNDELMKNFGIAGGDYYFRYHSDHKIQDLEGNNSYTGGVTANYRRNLFVRGIPVKENSSYRLTLYLKVNQDPEVMSVVPTFYADVMKGYFHSEKPFYTGNSSSNGYSTTYNSFEYKKTQFTGGWEKVTFMTYYLNDSVQEIPYNSAYYWANDWTWYPKEKIEGIDSMNYIQQPDKFFVRLSFASDSTEFLVDNISLTKSWIGGVEYYNNKIRVDFGYPTNLKDLAFAEKATTNIDAIALPGEYFTVLGYYAGEKDPDTKEIIDDTDASWYEIPINSAEYHGDGYMYMWTKNDEEGDPITFDYYDTVLVSFRNPVDDPKLCLVYTDKNVFPKALDKEWVDGGKKVPDFYNEQATLNPFVFDNVYSMMDRPPVLQRPQFENGSFGLDGSIRTLTMKMSRNVIIDPNATEQTEDAAWCRVTGPTGKEVWPSVSCDENGNLVFQRPADKTQILKGAYKFEFFYLRDASTNFGDPFTLEYEFGDFDKNPDATPIFATDWRSNTANEGIPMGFSIWNSSDKYKVGDGTKMSTKNRLYYTNPDKSNGLDCGFYLSSRGQKQGGHLYYGTQDGNELSFAAGTYTITFEGANWDGYEVPISLYFYPKSKFALDGTTSLPAIQESDRTLIAVFTPTIRVSSGTIQNYNAPYGNWENGSISYAFDFTIPTAGDYVIEWESAMGESGNSKSYGGMMLSNFSIIKSLGMSFKSVSALNKALAEAKKTAALANVDVDGKFPYTGASLNEVTRLIRAYDEWKGNRPSEYDSITTAINTATANLKSRMDTVDVYYTSYNAMLDELDLYTEGDLMSFSALEDVAAIRQLAEKYEPFDCSVKAGQEIVDAAKEMDDAVAALEARKALNDKYEEILAAVEKLLNDESADKTSEEYLKLESEYGYFAQLNRLMGSDEAFAETLKALMAAKNEYQYKGDYIEAKTRQNRELVALADSLGYDYFGKADSIRALVAGLQDEDLVLQNVLREAVKLQVYKKFAAGEQLIDLDVSALMPNYFLYNEAEVGRDMENNGGKWRLKLQENTTAFPNWTVTPKTKGNWIPTTVKVGEGDGFMDWEQDGHVFAGGLRCTPNTQGSFTTTVEGLPEAYYWVGFYGQNQTSNVALSIVTDSTSYNASGSTKTGKFTYKEFGQDSIKVAGNLTVTINQTSDSGSEADFRYFILKLRGALGMDYAALASAQEEKLENLVTFVDAPAQIKNVKFFNLNGMEIDAPKAGQIAIRQIIGADGSIATEKVLVK